LQRKQWPKYEVIFGSKKQKAMKKKKNVGIVAHDHRKKDIMEWVGYNWKELAQHNLICTGTTGRLVEETLREKCEEHGVVPPTITRLKSGPLGRDGLRRENRCVYFLLGSYATATARRGCKGAAANYGIVQYSHGIQSLFGRLYR